MENQFSSVAQSCLTLCNPMNHSTPGLPVHTNSRSPPKPMSIESVLPSNHPISVVPFSSCPQSFPASGSMSHLFTSGGQSIGVSASTSVLLMNAQDWSPLGWTGGMQLCYLNTIWSFGGLLKILINLELILLLNTEIISSEYFIWCSMYHEICLLWLVGARCIPRLCELQGLLCPFISASSFPSLSVICSNACTKSHSAKHSRQNFWRSPELLF